MKLQDTEDGQPRRTQLAQGISGTQQVQVDSEKLRQLLLVDLDVVGGLLMPDTCTNSFPDFYKRLFQEIMVLLQKERDFSKLAIGFPRAHGKTAWIKLVIIITILCTDITFIAVVCVAENKAKDILRDVWKILESPNVRAIFSNVKSDISKDTETTKIFSIDGKSKVLVGAGWGGSVRGFNIEESRPEFMIFDDSQSKECAKSEAESRNYIDWFFSTALKAKSPRRCTFAYIGNMYPDLIVKGEGTPTPVYGCLLRNLQLNKFWKSYIVGAILVDGTALWEEVQGIDQLLEEYEQDCSIGQEATFMAEVMNDPTATMKNNFQLDLIKIYDKFSGELHQGNYIIIDPATDKVGSDDLVVTYVEVFDGRPKIMEIHSENWSSPALVEYVLKLAMEKQCNLIAVEAVAYQYTLISWFVFYKKLLGITAEIEFVPIYTGGFSKNSRLLTMIKALIEGRILLTNATYQLVIDQIRKFDPTKTKNLDDIMDTVAYSEKVMLEYGHHLMFEGSARELEDNFALLPPPESFSAGF